MTGNVFEQIEQQVANGILAQLEVWWIND